MASDICNRVAWWQPHFWWAQQTYMAVEPLRCTPEINVTLYVLQLKKKHLSISHKILRNITYKISQSKHASLKLLLYRLWEINTSNMNSGLTVQWVLRHSMWNWILELDWGAKNKKESKATRITGDDDFWCYMIAHKITELVQSI